jgi:hypothetical protein
VALGHAAWHTLHTVRSREIRGLLIFGRSYATQYCVSTMYVIAATALVQPVAKESEWHSKVMAGLVSTDFASFELIQDCCKLPIAPGIDDTCSNTTYTQISHAARSMYNEQTFLVTRSESLESETTRQIRASDRPWSVCNMGIILLFLKGSTLSIQPRSQIYTREWSTMLHLTCLTSALSTPYTIRGTCNQVLSQTFRSRHDYPH